MWGMREKEKWKKSLGGLSDGVIYRQNGIRMALKSGGPGLLPLLHHLK